MKIMKINIVNYIEITKKNKINKELKKNYGKKNNKI